MAKILLIRFSAIGDVAMTVPVVHSLATQYPQHEITVLSRTYLKPLFSLLPKNVSFIGVDFSLPKYEGISGLGRLYSELKVHNFEFVADLHKVHRSRYLDLRFRLDGVKVCTIDKGRKEKRRLVRKNNKIFASLPSSFRRYEDVLERLGFPVLFNFTSLYKNEKGNLSKINNLILSKEDSKWIGIAPFAKHKGKIYPIDNLEKVVEYLSKQKKYHIFLFGGGNKEKECLDSWANKYSSVTSVVGSLNMETELILMSHLDVMLSMDSANMHLASLVNIPVVSVWGATHPYAGFLGWKQLPVNTVQVDLPCRPCSIYGNKPCFRKDYACMNMITPQMVIDKIENVI